ncbi:HAD family hydrolase [Olleya aquimaris]|uniref:HAD superfamily hydrolase (TIGR01509 family)/HAD superfamily hydrolase (TIGR01549 family) n=1 Tax=Olleya aquimaris TaxID=639310 RepID=A0A327RL96_9FLAO|nr:HAD-IA family hydrolase [Olleya aquimaris]RAJ16404.1 HAD superfamily hydrolase (TIGR01509 family)/HAD superfamily hydrolase (TIGR01549 family) [Olleya aquimaris]
MVKAILFDMDGVIVDTEPLHHKAYYNMFSDFNITVNEDLYQSFTGQSTKNICKKLVNHFKLDHTALELELCKRNHFNGLFNHDESLTLLDGVLDIIQDYYNNGLTLVLASSASMGTINKVFTRFNLDQYFKAKISGADLKASKPHPEIFEKAAQLAGFSQQECIVIEDSTNGILAAKAAGSFCIGYDSLHSKNQDYSKADLVISDFKAINYDTIKAILD